MHQSAKNSSSHKNLSTQTSQQQRSSSRSSNQKSNSTKNPDASQINPSLFDKCVSFIGNEIDKFKNPNAKSGRQIPEDKNVKTGLSFTQDVLGIRQIIGGMICMEDGSIVGIQEIIPCNFYQKSYSERNFIYDVFAGFFRIAPTKLHLKMRTDKADVNKLINNVLSSNKDETNQNVLRQMSDYINYMSDLQSKESLCKRFYIIWEYEGDNEGKRSNDINQIYRSMEEVRFSIRSIFNEMGHLTVTPDDFTYYIHELLYKYFNPATSLKETLLQRYSRIKADEEKYNAGRSKEDRRESCESDYIAPKGIKRRKFFNDYILMDGVYHTYITVKDIGHPPLVIAGWTDLLCGGLGYDVDVLAQKLPYDQTVTAIKQVNKIGRIQANKKVNNPDKYEELSKGVSNKEYILKRMQEADEDLWNVLIIITIRADTYQGMITKKNNLVKMLNTKSIYTEDSFLVAFRNFKMTMPFMYFDKRLFNKNKRNYLSSSMASLYNYTAYELFDDTGIVLGRNLTNGSVVAINNYNTQIYSNANMLLLGASGSGKTFNELLMQRRMRLTGHRTFLVLPAKGYEYTEGVEAVGGEIIRLFPGGQICLNLMQIRPEVAINTDLLAESVVIEKSSLLAKKINSIITFLQMLMRDEVFSVTEISRLNSIITEIYSRFGITDDNNSIYRDKKKGLLKEMPIIQDLYEALYREPDLEKAANVLLPFVEGNFQNLNGQTNVCLTNKCIAFDIDVDEVGEAFLPAIMYLAFDCVYDLVKQDMLSKDDVFLDEVWRMLGNRKCAEEVRKMILLIRGYAGSVILATQDIEPLLENKEGKAIVSNTEIKILLKMKENQIKALSEVIDITPEDRLAIRKLKRGYGLIYSNGDKVSVEFKASDMEVELFTTDVNVKTNILKRRKAEKSSNSVNKKRNHGNK